MVEILHDTLVVELASPHDWGGFRQACRVLLAERIPPEHVQWRWKNTAQTIASPPAEWVAPDVDCNSGRSPHDHSGDSLHADLFSQADAAAQSLPGRALTPADLDRLPSSGQIGVTIARDALRTLQNACLHENPGRFALCHRWLARVQAEPSLRHHTLDRDWRLLENMAHGVTREIHKMHAFVRFRPVHRDGQQPLHIAWFEPTHHVLHAGAPFFVQRFANMHWAILTPAGSLHWDGTRLQDWPAAHRSEAPRADAGEALWLAYYASTFNPARLKPQAMLREMPRKYWKNLPETVLISPLIQQARQRTAQMLQDASSAAPHPTSHQSSQH